MCRIFFFFFNPGTRLLIRQGGERDSEATMSRKGERGREKKRVKEC